MPWIIDYPTVLDRMRAARFVCLTAGAGAFDFPPASNAAVIPWEMTTDEPALAARAASFWGKNLAGPAWIMPVAQWTYELEYGSRDWLPATLERIGIDAGLLVGRGNSAAIEIAAHESDRFELLVTRLLEQLIGSEFLIAFPDKPALCAIKPAKQLRWSTTLSQLAERLRPAST